ncbi:MAG: hypothetical protein F4Z28_03985 [Gammaproteobacteria bacterium]|nr:hypothetical protein [Gammaproteobacteria bacterium]
MAAATGAGALFLAALLAGLHVLLGGLTKPLGLGTAFLIPLLVPARRRRKERGDAEAPDIAYTPALIREREADHHGLEYVPGSRTSEWVAGSTNGNGNGRKTHSDAEAPDIVHTPALYSEREGDQRRPGYYVPGSRASSRIGSTRGPQRRLGR